MNKHEKFRMMIRLALVDNQFEESEKAFIQDLAKLHDISETEIAQLFQQELESKEDLKLSPSNLDFESKLDILADLIRIMKVDGKIYLSEIRFCEMVARVFGFEEKSVGVLSEIIHQDTSVPTNWDSIHAKMKKYVA